MFNFVVDYMLSQVGVSRNASSISYQGNLLNFILFYLSVRYHKVIISFVYWCGNKETKHFTLEMLDLHISFQSPCYITHTIDVSFIGEKEVSILSADCVDYVPISSPCITHEA